MTEEAIEAAAYAERVCNGEFPITYTKDQVIKYTTIDFTAGAEWAFKQPGWIDVKDRLPDNQANVIAVCDGFLKVMAYCFITDGGATDRVWCNCYGGINGDPIYDDYYNVTHWQPLPALPSSPNI